MFSFREKESGVRIQESGEKLFKQFF